MISFERTRILWNAKCETKLNREKILRIKLQLWKWNLKWYSRNEYKSTRICDIANNSRGFTQSTMQHANEQHPTTLYDFQIWTLNTEHWTQGYFNSSLIVFGMLVFFSSGWCLIRTNYPFRISNNTQWFCLQYLNI